MVNALVSDLAKTSNNAPGTTAAAGPAAQQKVNHDKYCKYFHDKDNNNGVSTCPNPDTNGKLPNADIDIEGFLLKDSYNPKDPDEMVAVTTLLEHLTPKVKEKPPAITINAEQGKEWVLKTQHLEDVKNIARAAVAAIISRRMGVVPDPTQPPPVKSTADLVKEIREKAGVPDKDIAKYPSYNEYMLALTKEHFFDPEYFIDLKGNIGAIKQEQNAVNDLITTQQQDIYLLQEQINALKAAAASLKMNAESKPSRVEASPL